MTTISVITTTQFRRRTDNQDYFLEGALRSVSNQTRQDVKYEHILGIDEGDDLPEQFHGMLFAEAPNIQTVANAALRKASGDYIALLEDDDLWMPDFIAISLRVLEQGKFDFVSSTSLEVDENGLIVRINDFPVPSSWLMPRSTFDAVGYLDEDLPVHQDNDWLGRLTRTGLKRAHLVECTAPIQPEHVASCRPWLANVQRVAALGRHNSPFPLVERTVHSASNLWTISLDKKKRFESDRCYAQLKSEYGEIPW